MIKEFYFREIQRSFYLDEQDIDKYLVCACVKNEEDYIIEWIEHYLNLGFDKIILIDNNDINNVNLPTKLTKYISNGTVQILDCRGIDSVQVPMYSDFCEHSNFKWCAFFDCDEFLEIGAFSNIKDFLSTIDCDCLCVNWLIFGSNGELSKKDGSVIERFPLPQMPTLYFRENTFMKSIVRGNKELFADCWFNGSHLPFSNDKKIHYSLGGYKDIISNKIYYADYPFHYKRVYLKHYYTKSFEEWIKKASRGWPDSTETLNLEKYFHYSENICPPFKYFTEGSFDGENWALKWKNEINWCDMVYLSSKSQFIYPLFGDTMKYLANFSNKVFAWVGADIDDSLYNIFLEYSFLNNNKMVFCFSPAEFEAARIKYGIDEKKIFYITYD